MKQIATLVMLATLGCLGPFARATSVVNVGTHYLLPDTPNQRIDIYIDDLDGIADVAGLDLNVQVGDGGTTFGGTDGPKIQSVDPVHGTIFSGNNDGGSQDTFTYEQIALRSVVTRDQNTIVPTGLFCSVVVDTTGFTTTGQSWDLNLRNTLAGASVLSDPAGLPLPLQINDGSIVLGDPPLLLETNPTDTVAFGNVLVGRSGQQNVQARNGGTEGNVLSGTFPAVDGEFAPETTQGFLLNQGETAERTYIYTPTARGGDQQDMTITSDGGDSTLTLSGRGVAPQQSLSAQAQAVLVGTSGAVGVDVENTGDGNLSGLGALSNLTGQLGEGIGTFARQGEGQIDLGDGQQARVDYLFSPTQRGFYQRTLTADFDNGSPDGTNQPHQQTYAVQGYGVAPVSSVQDAGAAIGLTRLGTSKTGSIIITNTGDGNQSNLGAISNLNGQIDPASGVFVGTGGAFSLTDSSSRVYSYTFTPTGHRVEAQPLSVAFTNGSQDGRNLAHHKSLMLVGTGVGPSYSADAAPGSTLSFSGPQGPLSQTLGISNVTTDSGGIEYIGLTVWYSIQGAGAEYFSLTGLSQGQVLNKADLLDIDIHFQPTLGEDDEWLWPGSTSATLWLYTDQNAAFGTIGDSYSYTLKYTSQSTIPEPMSFGLLGLATAGLGGYLRRARRSR